MKLNKITLSKNCQGGKKAIGQVTKSLCIEEHRLRGLETNTTKFQGTWIHNYCFRVPYISLKSIKPTRKTMMEPSKVLV